MFIPKVRNLSPLLSVLQFASDMYYSLISDRIKEANV